MLALLITSGGCSSLKRADHIVKVDGLSRKEAASKYYHEGVALFEAGDVEASRHCFEQALVYDPNSGPAHNNIGLTYFRQRDLPNAAEHFDLASALMPEDARPVNNLALALEAGGRHYDSIPLFSDAWSLDPNNPVYLGNLVRAKLKLGLHDESLRNEMQMLLFIEQRPEWKRWVEEQLVLMERVSEPAPELQMNNSERRASQSDPRSSLDDSAGPTGPTPFELIQPAPALELPYPEREIEPLAVPEPIAN